MTNERRWRGGDGDLGERRWRRRPPPAGTLEHEVRKVFAPGLGSVEGRRLWDVWRRTLRLLRPLGEVTRGNAVTPLLDGDETFAAMWAAIDGAERRVLCTTYILIDDAVGRRTRDALVAAARRGCEVVLQYDAFGSGGLRYSFTAPLVEAGGRVVVYNPLLRLRTRMSRLVRNHRKILVVDDAVAFCGGRNIAADYAGERFGTGRFRDVHLRLEGPCVADLARLVRSSIRSSGARAPGRGRRPPPGAEGAVVQVLESNVRHQRRAIQKALRYTLARAVKRCYFTSPYFVPPARLLADMRDAARRGVDVRVLTAGKSDVPVVRRASRHLYGRLLRHGVRIFEMRERTLHAKTATIDGVYAAVGSFNLDHWSYRRNLEVNVTALDGPTARRLEERFTADLALSSEVAFARWGRRGRLERLRDWIAYLLVRA
ncbi:MAG: phospholipase D-like domain-containing protein [Planctomycetota bacterium]